MAAEAAGKGQPATVQPQEKPATPKHTCPKCGKSVPKRPYRQRYQLCEDCLYPPVPGVRRGQGNSVLDIPAGLPSLGKRRK